MLVIVISSENLVTDLVFFERDIYGHNYFKEPGTGPLSGRTVSWWDVREVKVSSTGEGGPRARWTLGVGDEDVVRFDGERYVETSRDGRRIVRRG